MASYTGRAIGKLSNIMAPYTVTMVPLAIPFLNILNIYYAHSVCKRSINCIKTTRQLLFFSELAAQKNAIKKWAADLKEQMVPKDPPPATASTSTSGTSSKTS